MSRYDFKVFPDDDCIVPYDEFRSPPPEFPSPSSIEFEIKLRILNFVEAPEMEPLALSPIEQEICVPSQELINLEEDPKAIKAFHFMSTILADIGVPQYIRGDMAYSFALFARWMTKDGRFILCTVLPMIVEIKIVTVYRYYEISRGNWEWGLEPPRGPVPASDSAIKGLENCQLNTTSELEQCVICLIKFPTGSTVTRLPCSHLYHRQCITQWLLTNHKCPVCRYPLDR